MDEDDSTGFSLVQFQHYQELIASIHKRRKQLRFLDLGLEREQAIDQLLNLEEELQWMDLHRNPDRADRIRTRKNRPRQIIIR